MENNKKKPAKRSWFKYFLLLGFLWEFLGIVEKKEKLEKIEENFKEYLKEEEAEIEDYIEDKEGFSRFMKHSGKLFSEFFIPCHSNGHKPKLLRTRSLTLIVVILALLKVTIALYIFYFTAYQAKMSENMAVQVLELVNRDRVAQNLKPLSMNTVLNSSALNKANNMITDNYFAHYSPDGKKPWDFIDRNSYAYLFVGENLAMNFTSAESAHQALMLSPTHKENIMSDKYADIGLAIVNGEIAGKNTNILVELFAIRQESQVRLASVSGVPNTTVQPSVTPVDSGVNMQTVQSVPVKQEIVKKPATTASTAVSSPTKNEVVSTAKNIPLPPAPPAVNEGSVPPPPVSEQALENTVPANVNQAVTQSELALPNASSPVLAKAEVSPNEQIENNQITQVKSFDNIPDKDIIARDRRMTMINNFMLGMMAVLFVMLIINIIIKAEIQHKPVIVQTMLAIICLTGLIYLNFGFLENILPKLFVV